jgi:two-component system chemotaxis sensor kinase CheA
LIFEAGFSTSSTVNKISGRGMGMDIVVQRLKKIGGSVQIAEDSELGGSCFRLMLPLSLLSIQGLLVRADEEVYAIPVDYIDRTIVIDANDIRRVDGSPVIAPDGLEPMKIQWLSSVLFKRPPVAIARPNVVVTSSGGNYLGLVVDEIIGELEFVLKPLPWNLKNVPGINGAIILVDGSVALSVDVPAVVDVGLGETFDAMTKVAGTAAGRTPSILVADDSVSFRTLFSNMLAPAGYEVTSCVDGEAAWSLLRERSFDLLLTDVRMPGLDGFELTRKIRSSDNLKNLPVVMVTTLSDPDDIARGVEAGADEYVVKGKFDQDRILEAINRLI